MYSFSEGAGQSSGINIALSTSIAQALSVTITGGIYNVLYSNSNIYFITHSGPGTQPSTVNISGSDVNSTVIFQAGDVSVPLPNFNITDDTTALETNEIYQLSFISSTPSQDVTLGVPTKITITDDDGELIRFLIFFSFPLFLILSCLHIIIMQCINLMQSTSHLIICECSVEVKITDTIVHECSTSEVENTLVIYTFDHYNI